MTRPTKWTLTALIAAITLGSGELSQAQIVRFGRGAGVYVRAPYIGGIRVGVGPVFPGVIGVPVRPLLPRRRLAVVPPVGAVPPTAAPRYIPGATRATVRGGATAVPAAVQSRKFPSAQELAALDDGSLLNALVDAVMQLDADVAQFNTGAGWRDYFRLPDDALPPPTEDGRVLLGFNSLKAALDKMNAIAADSAYPMISGLPSFVATQQALTEVINRFGPPADGADAAGAQPPSEELPTPPPSLAEPENSSRRSPAPGEHSILSR